MRSANTSAVALLRIFYASICGYSIYNWLVKIINSLPPKLFGGRASAASATLACQMPSCKQPS